MPHAELKYSSDLDFDARKLLTDIEALLQEIDANSGPCKGRAYPAAVFNHTHVLINVQLFAAKNRGLDFVENALARIKALAESAVAKPCFITVELTFSPLGYTTGKYDPEP